MASIEERSQNGVATWRVVWRQVVDGERRKQQQAFPNAEQATRFRKLVEGSGNCWPEGWGPRTAPPVTVTFSEWGREAIAGRRAASERTRADYLRDLGRHFALIADTPIDALTAQHRARWLDDRAAAGLSDKTIRNLHSFASSIVADAIGHRPPLAEHNPFAERLGRTAAVRTEEMCFLTPTEFDTILGYVRDEYRVLVRLLFGTGLRYGEATALTVRDVDLLGRRTLTVTKAWKRTGTAAYVVGEPKTSRSRRTVSLSGELVDMLVPLVAGRRGTDLLFPGAGGQRLPHSEVYKRGWAPAIARANICGAHYAERPDKRGKPARIPQPCGCAGLLDKTPRIHDLRHSHASFLIAAGLPLAAISRRLGHSSIQITVDRYGHLDPALDAQINSAVDAALFAPTTL